MEQTIGSKLLVLKERSGLSLEHIAKAAGYSRASSIQRYFNEAYEAKYLPRSVADRLIEALSGFGDPPIIRQDIEELTEYGFLHRRQITLLPETALRRSRSQFIECCSTFPAEKWSEDRPEVFHISNDPTAYYACPEHLQYRAIYAIFVSSGGMMPRFMYGDVLIYETERPASLGNDVLLILPSYDSSWGRAVLGILVDRTPTQVEVEFLNPPMRVTFATEEYDAVYPVLRLHEILTAVAPTR